MRIISLVASANTRKHIMAVGSLFPLQNGGPTDPASYSSMTVWVATV